MSAERSSIESLLGDVVAFTALPAVWVGHAPASIARALADALDRTLFPHALAVVMRAERGEVEARAGDGPLVEEDVQAWRASQPLPPGVVRVDIGPGGSRGVILLRAEGLPAERLLLVRLAANLADTALREAALQQQAATTREQLMRLEKLSALGQLVSGVAHELRTPLTYAGNNLYLAQSKLARAPGLAEDERAALQAHLAEVLSAHDRIERTVRTLRGLARPGRSEQTELGLNDAVAEAIRLFVLTNTAGTQVASRLEASGRVHADRVQLQQVVLNLLLNASEAMQHRGRIEVRTADVPEGVQLIVDDTGPGIPSEARDRVFDPFYTTKGTGMGLGLSIVRRIVETHRGSIQLAEAPGGGARVIVALPTLRHVPVDVRAASVLTSS